VKSHVRFIVCVGQSVGTEQLGSQYTDIREILYWRFVLKSVDQIQFWLKSDKNNTHFTRRPTNANFFTSLNY